MHNKSIIFRTAWACFKDPTCKLYFADCLHKAWEAAKLKMRLRTEDVNFAFVKDDGTLRHATGRINSELGTGKSHKLTIIPYFDVIENGMRSFRIDRLL